MATFIPTGMKVQWPTFLGPKTRHCPLCLAEAEAEAEAQVRVAQAQARVAQAQERSKLVWETAVIAVIIAILAAVFFAILAAIVYWFLSNQPNDFPKGIKEKKNWLQAVLARLGGEL